MKSIAVFCSSSNKIAKSHLELAKELGKQIALSGYALWYGGTNTGAMGELAKGAKQSGGWVGGVVPPMFASPSLLFKDLDRLIITESMAERKTKLIDIADAFIALPGGLGTFDELTEAMTLKQLELHTKPIVILNHQAFYTSMIQQFQIALNENFIREQFENLWFSCETITHAFDYIESYKYTPYQKWY